MDVLDRVRGDSYESSLMSIRDWNDPTSGCAGSVANAAGAGRPGRAPSRGERRQEQEQAQLLGRRRLLEAA
jgi:hypothetical protein